MNTPHPLSNWRPRYWLPASVSRWARNDQTFRRVLMVAADLALALFVAGLAWEFRADLGTINVPDGLLLIGLAWIAHTALAIYLPSILLQSSSLKAWWLSSGPLPLDVPTAQALDRVLRQNPEAGPLVLDWLVRQGLEQVHMAHAIKVIDAHWKTSLTPTGEPSAWGLDEVQARARAHAREKHLVKTLEKPVEEAAPRRARL